MKKLLFIIIASCTLIAEAQETLQPNWKKSGKIGVNFSQSYLSNWAAGGQSAFNTKGILNYSANYAKDNVKWDNVFDMNYGLSIIGDAKPVKTDDKIELNSLYGIKATKELFYSLAFSFKTQLSDGYDYKVDSSTAISKFMAPGYITLGAGMDWKPNDFFALTFSPLTARITVVANQQLADSGAFGVEKGENTRFEFGAKASARLKVEIVKNVTFSSKLELYSNYLKNPQNIDVDWQNQLLMKVNDWLNAIITADLIYDDDIIITDNNGNKGPRTQFKEVLSIGIVYGF